MSFIDPAGKVFQHLDRLQALKKGRPLAPINVEIDLSNRCSLGCEWCHFAFTHTRGPLAGKRAKPAGATPGGDLMPYELAAGIIEQFHQAGVLSVTWTGGGEPTLHPDFDRIIDRTASLLPQGLYTHGGHISQDRARLLKECLTFVYVSLDAADAADYKRDKGVDRFDAACEGIRRLAAAGGNCTVGVGFLLGENNWWRAREMVTLGKQLGAEYIQFRPTILYDMETPDRPSEGSTDWMMQPLRELLDGLAADPGVEIDVDRFRMHRHWKGHGYETCWWSGLQTVVTPNGKMWTCVNKREHPDSEIGDLSIEKFQDVWRRHQLAKVDGSCRVMCRGHIPNLTVDAVMTPKRHAEFV